VTTQPIGYGTDDDLPPPETAAAVPDPDDEPAPF
jgi:hypothetical protein